MQAIILAAGMGKRLGELTERNTKCMVKVDGITLIERMLRILDKKKLSRIILVVGYQYENLTKFVDSLNIATPIEYIINEYYGAAEPPVRCGESHLSGLTEPLRSL